MSINQFEEIFMSVAWPGIRRLGRRHWDRGADDFAWCSGDGGLTCHWAGGGMTARHVLYAE